MRHAFEIRNETFPHPARSSICLRKYDVALVCADTVEWPRLMDLTSDFVYCRLHGSEELYASGYDDKALDDWAARVATWAKGGEPADAERVGGKGRKRRRDVFVYFDNDTKVRAPFDAKALTERVDRSACAYSIALADFARSRSTNFWIFPVEVFGKLAEHEALRHLEARHVLAAERRAAHPR